MKDENVVDIKQAKDSKPVDLNRAIVYRGERIVIPGSVDCYVELKNSSDKVARYKIRDISCFGMRVSTHDREVLFILNEVAHVTIYFYGQQVFEANISVANESLFAEETSYGLAFITSFIDLEKIRAIISNSGSRGSLQIGTSLIPMLKNVRPEFKSLIADLNSIFSDIKQRLEMECERIESTALNDSHKERMLENTLSLSVSLNIQTILEVFTKFQDVVSGLTSEENSLHKKYFRLNFGETIRRTPFLKRALEKPLGYPGDYGLMVMFYDYKDLGDSIFDRFMHRLSCNQPIAVANQNRVEFLADKLEEYYINRNKKTKSYKMSSIACGPAQELRLFFDRATLVKDDEISILLVDQETRALDYAIQSVRKPGAASCKLSLKSFSEDAVIGILKKRKFCDEVNGSDVIICAGLFDYLSDRVATKLTENLIELLSPGGRLLIGNVSTDHPNKFSMEYFMEWNLILRSPSQLLNLVPDKFKKTDQYQAKVLHESLGINLFLEVRRLT